MLKVSGKKPASFTRLFVRKQIIRAFAIYFFLALFTITTWAAIPLSTSTPYTQNFDGIGTAATASLPTDFRVDNPTAVRTVGSYNAAGIATVRAGGASLSTTASNGIYNFGSGTTITGSDRAIGFLSSGSATASGNLYVQLVNNTGGSLSGLQLSYNVEKYRNGSNPAGFRIQLYYSTDGITWTSAGSNFLTSFAANSDNTGFSTAPGATSPVSNQVLNVTIPDGGNIFLAWNYSVAANSTTTNAQALAVDDISILGVGNVVVATNPSGTGAANPSSVQAGSSTLLSVAVAPGLNPSSTGLAVSADLSSIGGSTTQQFFDDGSHGDVTAGDNVFSLQTVVPMATALGAKAMPAVITDAQSRSGTASISLTVISPSTPPTGAGSSTPSTLKEGDSTLLAVSVTPGSNPVSSGIGVTGDLSSIGGSTSQQFYDDGTHGDATANDNVFSFQMAVASNTSAGTKSLPIAISDAQSRSGSVTISVVVQPPPPPKTVKISQVYGGGGNSGATYTNDFIELFNQSSTPADMTGWSVQYSSATVSSWTVTPICPEGNCILQPYHYFLVQEAKGSGGTTSLPGPDAIGTLAMSGTQAKVALVASTSALSGNCPGDSTIIDLVGYGVANCAETSPTPALSNTTAAVRKNNGCVDTDNNLDDFVTIGPIPRNSAAPANYCGGDPAQLSGVGIANPSSVDPASNTVLTVKVTPATVPPSTNVAVVADLSSIGGLPSQPLAGDNNVFSFDATVGPYIPTGVKNILAKITDEEDREEFAPITLTVQSPTCGVERWSVKVGVDPDASRVNLTPLTSTIGNLIVLPAPVDPPGPPDNSRIEPAETNVYTLNATMTFFKKETDVDYHIVLQDEGGRTLIAEIPSPACIITTDAPRVPAPSPFATAIAAARAKFDAHFTATPFFQQVSVPVRVTGVGFFDFIHGQNGVAPNGIELHPVLDIDFLASTTSTLASSSNPADFGQPVTFTVTVSNGTTTIPTGTVTLYDGGNPGGTIVGTAALDANGQSAFTTSALSIGTHSLTATYEGDASSGSGTSVPLVQTIVLNNHAPVATDQLLTATYGTTASFALNASDPDAGQTLGYAVNAAPSKGSLNIANGGATYTPIPGASGMDSFTYTVTDPYGLTASAKVTITIVPANVTSAVKVTSTGYIYNRATRLYSSTLTLQNVGGASITGPIQLVLSNLPAGVTAAGASGVWNGKPYYTVPSSLAPGQTVTITINLSSAAAYSPMVYSGGF